MSRNIQRKLHKVIAELILLFGSGKWLCPQEKTILELESQEINSGKTSVQKILKDKPTDKNSGPCLDSEQQKTYCKP
jgi:hypothetical protein